MAGSSSPSSKSSSSANGGRGGADGIYSIPLSVIIINHQYDNLQNNLTFLSSSTSSTTTSSSDLKASSLFSSYSNSSSGLLSSPRAGGGGHINNTLSSSPNLQNLNTNLKNKRKSSSFNSFDFATTSSSGTGGENSPSFHINLQGLTASNKSLSLALQQQQQNQNVNGNMSPPTSPKYGKLFKNASEQESVGSLRRKFESLELSGSNRETLVSGKLLFLDEFYNVLNGKSRKFNDIDELFQRCDIFLSLLIGDLGQFKCLEMFRNEDFSSFSTTFKYPHLESFDLVIQEILTNNQQQQNQKKNSTPTTSNRTTKVETTTATANNTNKNGVALLLAHEYLHKWLTQLNSSCHEYLKLLSQQHSKSEQLEQQTRQSQQQQQHIRENSNVSPIFEEIEIDPFEEIPQFFDFNAAVAEQQQPILTRKSSSSSANAFDIATSSSGGCGGGGGGDQEDIDQLLSKHHHDKETIREIVKENPIFDLKENENPLLISLKILNQMFYTELDDHFTYFQKTNTKFMKKWFDSNVRNLPLHCIDAIQKRRKRYSSYHDGYKLTEEDLNLKTIVDADFDFVHYLCEHTQDWQLLNNLFGNDSSIQVYKSKENYSTIPGMKLQKYITRVNYPIEAVARALLANEANVGEQYGSSTQNSSATSTSTNGMNTTLSGKYHAYQELDLNSSSKKYSTVIQTCMMDFGPIFRKRCLENVISARGSFAANNELVEVTQLYKTCSYLKDEELSALKIVMIGTRCLQKEDSHTTRIVDSRMFHYGGVMNSNLIIHKLSVKKMVQDFSDHLNKCLELAKKNGNRAPDIRENLVWKTFSDYCRMHYKIDVNK